MKTSLRNASLAILSGLTLLSAGCSTTAPRSTAQTPSQLALPAEGRIGLISSATVPGIIICSPPSQAEKVTEVLTPSLAERDFRGQLGQTDPRGAVFIAAPYLAGKLIYSGVRLVGAATIDLPTEKRDQIHASLRKASREYSVRQAIASRLDTLLQTQYPDRVFEVPQPRPTPRQPELELLPAFKAGTLAWLPPGETRRTYLQKAGADLVLEIVVEQQTLAPVGRSFAVRVAGQAYLWCMAPGRPRTAIPFRYQSPARPFPQWAEDDCGLFFRELEQASRQIASDIARPLLLAQTAKL